MRLQMAAPLHPIFVHFTIALTGCSLAFDLSARVFHVPSLHAAGWWSIVAASVITVGTLASGVVTRARAPIDDRRARSYVGWHMAVGPALFGCMLAMTLWRSSLWERGLAPSWIYLGALTATVVLMTLQGYLGGELVYRFGVEVKGAHQSNGLK
jgi:uncharacterized membrane protein